MTNNTPTSRTTQLIHLYHHTNQTPTTSVTISGGQPVPCQNNPEQWFDPPYAFIQPKAQTACDTVCPMRIRSACLRWAVDTGESDGVWGGATTDEIRDVRATLGVVGAGRVRMVA